jgi:endonuclease-3
LGKRNFPRGYYTYTGSALGKGATSLRHRIGRHLKKEKRKFWHIDYLLAEENMFVEAVIVAETNNNKECKINQTIKTMKGARVPFKGFGASDCEENCESHLLYFSEMENADFLIQKIVRYIQSASGVLSVGLIH